MAFIRVLLILLDFSAKLERTKFEAKLKMYKIYRVILAPSLTLIQHLISYQFPIHVCVCKVVSIMSDSW